MNSCKHEFIHVYYTKDNKPYDIDYPYSYEQYNLMCKCEKCGKIFDFNGYLDEYVDVENQEQEVH